MKKNILKGIGYFLSLMLVTQSCRTESLVSEQENQPNYNYNISILDKEQVESKLPLLLEVNKLKTNFFKPVTTTGKTTEPQDPILDGAIIETDRVLEITSGSDRTYTFPVSRTFSNDKIENLVLRENSDNTYSGVLIQYSLNKQEKELYTSGAKVDLTGKIKIYSINNITIAGKGETYSYYQGCWEYVYESNPCAGTEHHGYGAACPLAGTSGAAQPAQLIAAFNHCGSDGGGSSSGGSSDTGGSNNGNTGGYNGGNGAGGTINGGNNTGGSENPSTNPYNTFVFTSFDDRFDVCADGDEACQAERQLNIQVQQYLLSKDSNINIRKLSTYSKIWETIKNYYLVKGYFDQVLTERLNLVANWYNTQNNINEAVKLDNFKVASWALTALLEDDTQDFQNFFNRLNTLNSAVTQNSNLLLDIPCSQLPFWQDVATHQVPQSVKTKLENIKNQTSWWSNWQITDLDDGASARINMDLFPIKINTLPNKPNSTQKYTPEEFFNFFRLNINLFAEKFTPIVDSHYGINDTALWNSSNPLGALIHIEIPADDGTVICSGFSTNTWIFSTIKAPMGMAYDGIHPVAGNRVFSYYMEGSTMYIYTRGVDRVSKKVTNSPNLANYLMESTAFYGADQLWTGMQYQLSAYINQRGGNAIKVPEVTYRPKYSKIRDYLKGKAPLSSLDCN